ncbi:MAG: class I SAM-dependent rRNA methyltransferase [Pseudomonadales bacterium]|nr:class I SAM-dependent rRNA methyltransferase [Pseudomonadales bacterium]
MTEATLRLKKNGERRIRRGHPWVYSNEIDIAKTPLKGLTAGIQATIEAYDGKPLGSACINPGALIRGRLYSRSGGTLLDIRLISRLLKKALLLREKLFSAPYYRLCYGDGDGLSGLVIDRYGDVLVVQISTAGMEALKQPIIDVLQKILSPKTILLKNDSGQRVLEGLEKYSEVVVGTLDELTPLEENGVRFLAPLAKGQKTGWFYDHRFNRAQLSRYVNGMRVLDLYSYVGGWGIQAATFGASEVVMVDSSTLALEVAGENARLNEVQDKCKTVHAEVLEALKQFRADGEKFDMVILDPPALIKRKKDQRKGEEHYHNLNQQAVQLLNPNGFLVSGSCSMNLSEERLIDILGTAAHRNGRTIQILEKGGLGADHPLSPAIPEMDYLKSVFCYMTKNHIQHQTTQESNTDS